MMSKQYGREDFLTSLISQACVSILTENSNFNVDNVRVCKIIGCGIQSSQIVQGMVFKRQVEGDVSKKTNCKIVVYTCPVDITPTETKGTVLIKSADELLNFSRGEESMLEAQIKSIDPLLLTSALNAGLQILLKLFITTFIISKIFIFQIILAKAGTLMQILYYYYSGI